MLHYCKKCGRIVQRKTEEKICDNCKSIVYPVPEKYWLDGLDFLITNDAKKLLREELVKTSPEFDQYLFDHREEDMSKRRIQIAKKMNYAETFVGPKCPTCQSTNIRKISGLESGVSIAMLGVFSKKINKTFKCNSCGYTW